jgi:hypothetical protein
MDMDEAAHVHFVELAGEGARERLSTQAAIWSAQGVRTTLLRSADDDALWLLVGRAVTPPPAADVAGARTWRFASAPAVRS